MNAMSSPRESAGRSNQKRRTHAALVTAARDLVAAGSPHSRAGRRRGVRVARDRVPLLPATNESSSPRLIPRRIPGPCWAATRP